MTKELRQVNMHYKYGDFPESQIHSYKHRLHSLVHWLLIYKEDGNEALDNYFQIVQCKLNGFNELLEYPPQMLEIMNLIESARLEAKKEDFNHKVYRSLILDAHSLIDELPEDDEAVDADASYEETKEETGKEV